MLSSFPKSSIWGAVPDVFQLSLSGERSNINACLAVRAFASLAQGLRGKVGLFPPRLMVRRSAYGFSRAFPISELHRCTNMPLWTSLASKLITAVAVTRFLGVIIVLGSTPNCAQAFVLLVDIGGILLVVIGGRAWS